MGEELRVARDLRDFIAKLNALIADNSDLAKGLIIEVKQQTLAELSKEGQEGLAKLAEAMGARPDRKRQLAAIDLARAVHLSTILSAFQ